MVEITIFPVITKLKSCYKKYFVINKVFIFDLCSSYCVAIIIISYNNYFSTFSCAYLFKYKDSLAAKYRNRSDFSLDE